MADKEAKSSAKPLSNEEKFVTVLAIALFFLFLAAVVMDVV